MGNFSLSLNVCGMLRPETSGNQDRREGLEGRRPFFREREIFFRDGGQEEAEIEEWNREHEAD